MIHPKRLTKFTVLLLSNCSANSLDSNKGVTIIDLALAIAILTAIGGVVRAIVEPIRIGVLLPLQTKYSLSDELVSSLTLLLSALVGIGVSFAFGLNILPAIIPSLGENLAAGMLFTGVLSAVPAEIWHSLLEALGNLPRPQLVAVSSPTIIAPETVVGKAVVVRRLLPWSTPKAA